MRIMMLHACERGARDNRHARIELTVLVRARAFSGMRTAVAPLRAHAFASTFTQRSQRRQRRLERERPLRPVRATLAVHDEWRPQGPVGGELRGAAVDKGSVRKDDGIAVAGRHTCAQRPGCAYGMSSLARSPQLAPCYSQAERRDFVHVPA
jgi:hypothetical protein